MDLPRLLDEKSARLSLDLAGPARGLPAEGPDAGGDDSRQRFFVERSVLTRQITDNVQSAEESRVRDGLRSDQDFAIPRHIPHVVVVQKCVQDRAQANISQMQSDPRGQ